jgi:uncharacterized protein YlxW (UPF0749 family)
MSTMSTTPDDLAALDLQTRRVLAEAVKLEAENRKLRAEADKLASEQRKLDLESDALHRWRNVAMPVGVASLAGALAAGLVGIVVAAINKAL